MEDQHEGRKYSHHQFRLAVVNHFVDYREKLFEEVKEDIRMSYGALEDVESETGSMSYKTYLQYMMKNGTWGDTIVLKGIASMWAAKLTVFHADTLTQTKFRHTGDPFVADICVLFNGSYTRGHYSSIVRSDGRNFIIGTPKLHESYNRKQDRVERIIRREYDWQETGESEMMAIPIDLYRQMLHKCEQFDKMAAIAKEKEAAGAQLPPLPSLDQQEPSRGDTTGKRKKKDDTTTTTSSSDDEEGGDDGEGGKKKKKKKKRDPSDPKTRKRKGGKFAAEEKIPEQELSRDVTVCPRCKIDKKSHSALLSHIQKFHEDSFNFLCKTCDRGFMTRRGWKNHRKSHKIEDSDMLKCDVEGCESKFTTIESKKGHMRKYHPKGGPYEKECQFKGCKKVFYTKSNYDQHIKSCKKNPKRCEFVCDACGKSFYLLSRLQEHKRDNHRWR